MIGSKQKLKKLRALGAADDSFRSALRSKLMAMQPTVERHSGPSAVRYVAVFAVLIVMLILGTSSYAYASNAVAEGDRLFPVKTTLENLEGNFANSPEAQVKFQTKIAHRRIQETNYRLARQRAPVPTSVDTIDRATGSSVQVLQQATDEQSATELNRDHVKEELYTSMEELRTRIESSDLSEEQKTRYLDMLDRRLEQIEALRARPDRGLQRAR
jgi:hypothetical protein